LHLIDFFSLVITDKQTDTESEEFKSRGSSGNAQNANGNAPDAVGEMPPVGLAPIAQDEDLDSNCNETLGESETRTWATREQLQSSNFNAFFPLPPPDDSFEETPEKRHPPVASGSSTKTRRSSLPHQILLDSAKLLLRERSSSGSALNNRKLNPRHAHSTGDDEDEDEEDASEEDDDEEDEDDEDEEYWGSDLEDQLAMEEEKNADDKVAPDKGHKAKPILMAKRDREDSFVST
jgi:hypothetical protein